LYEQDKNQFDSNPFIILNVGISNAQVNSSGYAITIPVKQNVVNGDMICSYSDGFKKCKTEYDISIYGVIADNASVSLEDKEIENGVVILTNGIAEVRVTAVSGNIKEGDYITSSNNEGIGQKATKNGYVLGSALENFEPGNANDIGSIQVAINIHPAQGLAKAGSNLLQFIRQGVAVPLIGPLESLRYLLAVLMVLISFTLGMIYFGRSSRTGIEAIGRNPLAKNVIQITVLMNILLTIVIVLVGLGIAYIILVM